PSSAVTSPFRFKTPTISALIVSGSPHKKAEVTWLQIAVEASLAQLDSNRIGATGERGLAVSLRCLTADRHIANQAVVMVPESSSSLDKTRACIEREGCLLVAEDLDLFQVT